jgi:hypothetical protein
MSSVIVAGDTSGSVTLQAPAVSGSTVLTLPTTTGTLVVNSGAQTIEFADGSASAPSITNSGDTNTGMFFPAADTIAFSEGGVESMRIDSSGFLLVNLTSNFNSARIQGKDSGSGVYGWTDSTSVVDARLFASTGQGAVLATQSAHPVVLQTNATERMRIDSSGQVSISNVSAFSTPEGVFTVNGNGCGNYIGAISNRNTSNCNPAHGLIFRAGYNGNASGSNYFSFRRPDDTVTGSITQTGSTTISFTTSSDYRLKENIAPMTGALAKVSALKPVTYTWREDGSAGQGFIAHELQEVVSDCVTGTKDETKEEQYEISPAIPAVLDEEGNEITPAVEAVMGTRTVPVYQGIDTSFLVATLTAAIQELKAIVDTQAEQIKALQGVK